jgi:hypothetical protein
VPTPIPSPAAGAWKRVADQPALSGTQLQFVVWTGARFVAAGVKIADGSAVFLDSPDALTWHLQTPSLPKVTIRDLAWGPGGVLAVGDKDGKMVSWLSPDGLTWSAAPAAKSMEPAAGKTLRVGGAAAAGPGWIVVGEEDPPCPTGCVPDRAVVWLSSDGMNWVQLPAPTELAGVAVTAISPWDTGYVAVGRAGQYAAVWSTPDGTKWTRVADVAAFHAPAGTDQTIGAGMTSVATDRTHLVAVGEVFTQGDVGSALAWSTTDGTTWAAATGDKFLHGQMFKVAAVSTGFLAVGPSGSPSCLGGIWSSATGTTWTCVADASDFASFNPWDVTSSPALEVVVGFGKPSGAMTASVWVSPVTRP